MGFFRAAMGRSFAELQVGQRARFSRRITKQDVLQYMGLSGDLNPLYADSAYAGRTKYEQPIVPANMMAGFVMGAVATVLPGPGSLTHAHTYRMVSPARVEEVITAEMEIADLKAAERRVLIRYRLLDEEGHERLVGEIEVEPPEKLRPILHHAYENF